MPVRPLLLALVIGVFLAGCSPSDSGWGERTDVFACDSPDTALTATFYVRQGGGAAGSQEEYVSVRASVGGPESVVLQMSHGYNVRLAWIGSNHLTIGYPREANMLANWRKKFRKSVGSTEVDIELTPIDSRNGLLADGDQCIGGRPSKPVQPTSGAGAAR
jgi:hypothetical protein